MSAPKYPDVHVRLSNENGNAYSIIARTLRALRIGGVPTTERNAFTTEAESGDYNNVLQTVMRWVSTS